MEFENAEIKMGVTLACLLLDPPIVQKCLGYNSSASMIGDEIAAGFPAPILDASIAPSLTWQYEEGFLSNSTGPGSEPEFDPPESCSSEADSSSTESESGIPGGDNSDATVLSRSSFSFSFEAVVTEESDGLEILMRTMWMWYLSISLCL